MDYSYFKDTGGDWWWRIHAEDGSVVMDSGGGYSSEQECIEAIKRIKGSANGSVLRHADAESLASAETTKKIVTNKKTERIGKATTESDSNKQLAAAPPASVETKESATQKKAEDTETEKTGKASTKSDSESFTPDMTLGDSPVACVFTTTDNQLRWRYKANNGVVPFRLLGAVSEFDSIMSAIAVSVPRAHRKETYHQLGKALFAAFHTPQGTRPGREFRKVRLFVRKKAKERARLSYVLASLATTTVLALVVVTIYFYFRIPASNLRLVILGGCFGAVGATISVLQRSPSLELDPWMSRRYHALQGVTRIVLGFIFGGIFVIASKANFVLGVIRNNPYPLLILCIVAGFSERLIPELLSKFESTQSTSNSKQ